MPKPIVKLPKDTPKLGRACKALLPMISTLF
jgi:hypothetical protein